MTLRDAIPVRSDVAEQAKYTRYRDDLRADFKGRCGYCDDSDANLDPICFHIDHFAPQKLFPDLATAYENLVYACRFCNMRKSYHWIGIDATVPNDGERGFVDPCDESYDEHLERSSEGAIIPKTELGNYMIERLGLYLLRHQTLWNARRLRQLREEIDPLIERCEASGLAKSANYIALLKRYRALTKEIDRYEGRAYD